jgi:hypothetical protein
MTVFWNLTPCSLVDADWQFIGTSCVHVRFEVFTAVTMKNAVVWKVTLCGSYKNRRFGGT